MQFNYTAIDEDTGEALSGTLSASNIEEATLALRNSSIYPTKVVPSSSETVATSYDSLTATTAMILWELYLDEDRLRYESGKIDPAPKWWPILREVREGDGFRALRQIILEKLAPACVNDYPDDFEGDLDWDFCPHWLTEKAHLYL